MPDLPWTIEGARDALRRSSASTLCDTQFEYRVIWRRLGLSPRVKLYQSYGAAERHVRVLRGELLRDEDPDDYACCSGNDCACRGFTNAEAREERYGDVPPFVTEPHIEARPVGAWSPATVPAYVVPRLLEGGG